jgi:hypothetical protein
MKLRTLSITAVSLLALPATAEVTKLGDFSLGASQAKAKFAKGSAFGCQGSFGQRIDAKNKISGVEFTSSGKCKAADVERLVEKEYGGKPIVSTDKKAKLWEGKTSAVIVVTRMSGVTVKLVTPGAGAKRACFPDDGFAAFWKTFKDGLGKADAAAATFKYPIKDFEGKVVVKDAKAMAKKWPTLIDADDKKELASGELLPTCSIDVETYDLRLANSYVSFEAKKIGDKWMWVEINDEASG